MKKLKLLLVFLFIFSVTAMAQDGQCDIYIYNDIGHAIYYIYVSPSDASDWGPDLLEDVGVLMEYDDVDIVFDGDRFRSTVYDIKIVDKFDKEVILWEVDLSSIWGIRVYKQGGSELAAEIDWV